MHYRFGLYLFAIALFVAACSDDDNTTVNPPSDAPIDTTRGLYIANEGQFGTSTSTLSFIVPDSLRVLNDVFGKANNKTMGDVANCVVVHNRRVYVVMSNSNAIQVIEPYSHKLIKTIALVGKSPRGIAFDGEGEAYVSTYNNVVLVLNDSSYAQVKEIPVGQKSEQIVAANGRVYVANSGWGADNTVSVIDAASNTVEKTLTVGDNPGHIEYLPASNRLAVVCGGNFNPETPGKIFLIDASNATISDSILIGGHPTHIAADNYGYIYTINNNKVAKIRLTTKEINADFIVPVFPSSSLYSLICDNENDLLYVSDALNFTQTGTVDVFVLSGQTIKSYKVGVIPGAMAWTK